MTASLCTFSYAKSGRLPSLWQLGIEKLDLIYYIKGYYNNAKLVIL